MIKILRMKGMIGIFIIYSLIVLILNIPANESEPLEKLSVRRSVGSNNVSSSNKTSTKKHIVVATIELEPFMMKRLPIDTNGTVEWYGYCMDFFNELIKHLPYEVTYEIYQVSDNKFGSKLRHITPTTTINDNNQQSQSKRADRWNGLIGDLYQNKAHLALAPLAVMAERELAMDFTVPFYDLVGIQILLKKPEVPQDWFKFLTVLDREVWFSITIAYFVTSFVMFLFDRLSPYSHKNLTRIQKLRKRRNLAGKNAIHNQSINSISKNIKEPSFIANSSKMNGQDSLGIKNSLGNNNQLFIGSLRDQIHEVRRESSLLFFNGFELASVAHRGSDSPMGASSPVKSPLQRETRKSQTLSDFLRGMDFRKSLSGLEADDLENSDTDDGRPEFGLKDSLWFCITSLTPQGGGEAPQNLSGRVVAGAWWLFCFIIIASYTANLAAFLTVSRLDIPIDSLDDLAKQYRIKYAPIDGSAEQTYFERMAYIEEIFYNIWKDMSLNESLSEEERSKFAVWDYPISDKYTKIWAQIQQVGMPADTQSAIRRVKSSTLEDGFALLADANMVRHAVMTDCSFKAVGEEFSRKPIALGVRKGDDQFRDDLSYAILQLINQRFMEVLREKWWTNNPNRVICDNNDESEGISIENIVGVFIIIFAGVVLSFFVWAVERFVYKTKIEVSQDLIRRM